MYVYVHRQGSIRGTSGTIRGGLAGGAGGAGGAMGAMGPMGPMGPHGAHGAHGAHGPPWGSWGPWGPMRPRKVLLYVFTIHTKLHIPHVAGGNHVKCTQNFPNHLFLKAKLILRHARTRLNHFWKPETPRNPLRCRMDYGYGYGSMGPHGTPLGPNGAPLGPNGPPWGHIKPQRYPYVYVYVYTGPL